MARNLTPHGGSVLDENRVDPDEGLPSHDFVLVPIIPLTRKEVNLLSGGQRVVFKKLDIYDRAQVRGAAVYCARCEIPLERLGDGEREVCRG